MVNSLILKSFSPELLKEFQSTFPEEHDNPKWDLEKIQEFIKNDDNVLIAGYIEDKLAGFVYGYKLPRLDTRKEFLVYEVGVNEEYRRKGVATSMLSELIKYLKEKNFDEAWVLTDNDNTAAVTLYSKSGAKPDSGKTVMFEWTVKDL